MLTKIMHRISNWQIITTNYMKIKQQITLTSQHWGGLPTIWIPSSYRNTFQHQSSYNDLYLTLLNFQIQNDHTTWYQNITEWHGHEMTFLGEGGSVLSACATFRIYYRVWYLSHSRDHYGRLLSTYPLLKPTHYNLNFQHFAFEGPI